MFQTTNQIKFFCEHVPLNLNQSNDSWICRATLDMSKCPMWASSSCPKCPMIHSTKQSKVHTNKSKWQSFMKPTPPTKHTFLIMTKLRFPWINCQQLYDMTTWKLQLHSKRVWVRIGYTFKWLRSFTILQISSSILCGFCWAFDIFWPISQTSEIGDPFLPALGILILVPLIPVVHPLATPHLHPCRLGVSRRFRKEWIYVPCFCSMFHSHEYIYIEIHRKWTRTWKSPD